MHPRGAPAGVELGHPRWRVNNLAGGSVELTTSDQDALDFDGVAECGKTLEKLPVRTFRFKADGNVARCKPLAQILQPPKQVMKSEMRGFHVFRVLDRNPNNPVPRPPHDRPDHIAALGASLHNVTKRKVVREERDATDFE